MGTKGRGELENTSQRMEDRRKGMETRDRDGLESMDWMERQADCKAGRAKKKNLW